MDTAAAAASQPSSVCWHRIQTGKAASGADDLEPTTNGGTENVLEVSNPSAPLPLENITVLSNFWNGADVQVHRLESELKARQNEDSTWEGFDGPRRRVQSYQFDAESSDDSSHFGVPETLVAIRQHLKDLTGLTATSVKVEEYVPVYHKTAGQTYSPTILSSFVKARQQQQPCSCVKKARDADKNDTQEKGLPYSGSCSCFVAEIPLVSSEDQQQAGDDSTLLVQNWNQPVTRQAVCWYLRSDQHWTDVRLSPHTAIVKRGDMLTEWRSSRVLSTCATSTDTVRVLKLYSLAASEQGEDYNNNGFTDDQKDTFGYVPSGEDEIERHRRLQEPMPPLSDLLSIVITTSPIKSNPSTELLERAMETFKMGGHDFAYRCRKVIVCDGFRTQDDDDDDESAKANEETNGSSGTGAKTVIPKVTRKHSNIKQAMRNGIVTREQADSYQQFKQTLRMLCTEASSSSETQSVFSNTSVVELDKRHGYGFALRHAVRNCVDTPFVCVIQHDRTFMRPTPVFETVKAMWLHANIKYVGFSMRSNLFYRDIFLAKYGRREEEEFNDMVLHVPELLVPASSYGPDSASSKSMMMSISSDTLRNKIVSFAEAYKGSAQAATRSKQFALAGSDNGGDTSPVLHQMTLTPTLFWYDNCHICDTQHYRDFIFHESYKMVARGGFVEDKLSPVIKRTVERMGLREGHSRFGCYLLDDHSGMYFTGHLDGGSYMTEEERKALESLHRNDT